MKKFSDLEWSLVPGPVSLPADVFPSDQVQDELVRYMPDVVAGVVEGLDGVSVVGARNGDWWNWRVVYEGKFDIFELNMTLFDTEPPLWGGCDLSGVTDPNEALNFWRKVAATLPGTYLHSSEAVLYTFAGFVGAFITRYPSNG